MTCETAIVLLQFARPGGSSDLAADDAAALQTHLATCPACLAASQRHSAADSAIARAMQTVTVPSGLRDSLKFQAARTQTTLFRNLWIGRLSGLAAVVLIAALGFGGYQLLTKKAIDTQQMLTELDRRGGISSSFAFEDWRKAEGLPKLPGDFNTRYIVFMGRQPIQGVQVPCIRLRTDAGQEAVLYFIPPHRFDLTNAKDYNESQAGVKVFANLDGGYTIIVFHAGFDLTPFFHDPGAST